EDHAIIEDQLNAALRQFLATDLHVPLAEPVIELPELRRVKTGMRGALHLSDGALPARVGAKRKQSVIRIENVDAAETHLCQLIENGKRFLFLAGHGVLAHLPDPFARSLCEDGCGNQKDQNRPFHAASLARPATGSYQVVAR